MLLNKRIPEVIQKIYSYDSVSAISYGIFNSLVLSFMPIIMRKMDASDFVMGLLSISPVAGSILVFLWLNLALKVEKFKFLGIMKSIGRLILFVPLVSEKPLFFGIAFLLYNILEQGSSPTYVSIMNDIYPVKYRGFAMGMVTDRSNNYSTNYITDCRKIVRLVKFQNPVFCWYILRCVICIYIL